MTQPIIFDASGNPRFKENKIVRKLFNIASANGFGMNQIAQEAYNQDDFDQFLQLIGYSVGGYAELENTSDKSVNDAIEETKRLGYPWQQGEEAVKKWEKEHGYESH